MSISAEQVRYSLKTGSLPRPPSASAFTARDGFRCVQCGTAADLTLDHRVPLSRGGTNNFDNLQTMCADCNHAKADTAP